MTEQAVVTAKIKKQDAETGFRAFYRRFRRHRLAQVGLFVIIAEIVLVIILPLLLDLNPYIITDAGFNHAPTQGYPFGTDDVGRDLFARVIYGGRISLLVAFSAPILSVLIGLPLGLLAGYYRGVFEMIVLRLADIFMSFPSLILIIVLVAIFGSSIPIIIGVIGLVGWPSVAKLIYGNVISVRKRDYVEAARATGARDRTIIWKYVLPNSVAPLWVQMAFSCCYAILTESALSFLGAGVQPPMPSWGNIIYAAQNVIVLAKRPWIWMPPGFMLIITVVSINFIGEGIRDALDPRMKR